MNVNVTGFIRNINPFDKPQIKNETDIKQSIEKSISEKSSEENEISIEIEDDEEEEGNYFLRSIDVEKDARMNKTQNIEKKENIIEGELAVAQTNMKSNMKNLEISNILQFVNILKKKNIPHIEDIQDDVPKDPRMKNKKK